MKPSLPALLRLRHTTTVTTVQSRNKMDLANEHGIFNRKKRRFADPLA